MKNLNKKIIYMFALVVSFSCSDYTDGINESPNNFTGAPENLLIGQANLEVVKLSGSQASRTAGVWTDQFTGSDRQYITLNSYTVTAGDFDDDWDDLYANGLAQAKEAELRANANGNAVLEGVSQIVQALLLGEGAALWGDIPDSQALDFTNFPNPSYDSQAQVLDHVQSLLSSGITKVGSATVAAAYGSPIYKSNSATWGQIAHSLKARYYLVAKNYPMALAESKLGISAPTGDLISSHSNTNGAKNLYFQFVVEQRGGYLTAQGSTLLKLLNGTQARLLATPGDSGRLAKYFTGSDLNTSSSGYFAVDASFPIVSYVETKLIEAEAEQRVNGGNAGLAAFTAVRNHLATVYGGLFPPSTSTGSALTNEILEEKYISLVGSLQVFHDMRRTNNVLGVPVKNSTAPSVPQRFLYPQSEINSNSNFPGISDVFVKTPVNN
ncbi:SusD/RagB family nutrient-binding outer membrane lipoprotein [Geojedonia litorea]|uniref:SusD/RagB family nutrient-binding outer membrane lipoprotein n=1 Tax=Geojedonia litorea TaxID=1268269 RepID=A0ABV9N393_9FLAO